MAAPRKYPDELRKRAVRMVRESDERGAIKRTADHLGINPETLRNWVRQAQVDDGERGGVPTDVAVRRGPTPPTTTRRGPEPAAAATPDLVERDFTADRPDQLWVADLTYVPVADTFCYTALISDAYSRLIVGWAL